MARYNTMELNNDILRRNEDLFTLLTVISEDNLELKRVVINNLINLNMKMLLRMAKELNYEELTSCDFEDARQTVILAFVDAVEIAIRKGKTSWAESYIPGITRNIAKEELHLQYRVGGVTESYETHKVKRRNGQGPSVICESYFDIDNECMSEQIDIADKMIREELEDIVVKKYNSDLISDEDKEIIRKHVGEKVSFNKLAEELGINCKKVQRRFHHAMDTLAEAIYAEAGRDIVYEYLC